jgi:hypothetical protein
MDPFLNVSDPIDETLFLPSVFCILLASWINFRRIFIFIKKILRISVHFAFLNLILFEVFLVILLIVMKGRVSVDRIRIIL